MISRTSPSRHLIPFRLCLLIFVLTTATGCSLRGNLTDWNNSDQASEFLIQYTVKNAVSDLDPWSNFADRGLESASWTGEPKKQQSSARSAELQIQYPHPDRGDEFALATLTVYDRQLNVAQFATQPKKHWYDRLLINNYFSDRTEKKTPSASEIVTMQIPRTQFELLVHEMNETRYLDENHTSQRSFSTALLSVLKNQKAIHESSVEEPRLNEVIQNVYRNGEVVLGEKRQPAPSILQTSAFIEAPQPTVVN